MKKFLLYFALFCTINALAQCPLTEQNLRENGTHYKDLNTVQLNDGTDDIVIAGTRFKSSFIDQKLHITRVVANTQAVVWENVYDNFPQSRGFDITSFTENGNEFIAATGYAGDGVDFNKTFIVVVDASTGAVVSDATYTIDPNIHSQGLHIIYTERDIVGVTTPGFVVVGFSSPEYTTSFSNINEGFIMRTDLALNELWTSSTNSTTTAAVDYDMLNHVTETNDGYFVTGSSNEPNGVQQGIAMMKFNDAGNLVWEQNYIQGNSRDVATDALYDSASNAIYVLVYYSQSHYFGITTIDNTTGAIDFNRTWGASGNELNWTGISLQFSNDPNAPEDLVIFGYRRDATINDTTGQQTTASTVPFALSFNKFTGAVARANWFPIPYIDPPGYQDYFRFWEGQSPLIFHPDIGIALNGNDCYFMAANRSYGQSTSAIELIRVDGSLTNLCNSDGFMINQFTINPIFIDAVAQPITITQNPLNLIAVATTNTPGNCEEGGILATTDIELQPFKVYPNPASEILKLEGVLSQNAQYAIVDIQGKLLQNGVLNNLEISISDLLTGVYFLKISEENQNIVIQFIKE